MPSAPYQADIAAGSSGGLLDLRAAPAAASSIEQAMGVRLPATVGRIERSGSLAILALGPDHWLLRVSRYSEQEQYVRLEHAIGSGHGMVTVVSHAYVSYSVVGGGAVDVLGQGCPLDFDASIFPVGTCAASVLARGDVLLIRDSAGFELLVDRTHASYIWKWLLAAGGSEALQNV